VTVTKVNNVFDKVLVNQTTLEGWEIRASVLKDHKRRLNWSERCLSLRIYVNIEFSHVALVSGVQNTEAHAEGEVRQFEFQQPNRRACEFGQQGSLPISEEPCFKCYTYQLAECSGSAAASTKVCFFSVLQLDPQIMFTVW
jgi:hypothetical protein